MYTKFRRFSGRKLMLHGACSFSSNGKRETLSDMLHTLPTGLSCSYQDNLINELMEKLPLVRSSRPPRVQLVSLYHLSQLGPFLFCPEVYTSESYP